MTWLQAVVVFLPFAVLWNYLRRRGAPGFDSINTDISRLPVTFGFAGYVKAFIAWLFLFMRTFAVRPGIYYLGRYEPDAPLLVTGNFYLTLFLLAKKIQGLPVRVLVIDTEGINVWCSSGKGKFSAQEIIDKAKKCSLLREGKKLELVLPKFSLAGVRLSQLRRAGIKPVIGPLYADDVAAFLKSDRLTHRLNDRVRFDLKHRVFTAVPTAVQFFYNFLGVYVIGLGWLEQSVVWIATGLAFLYPVLFLYLPGKLFATKGISLGVTAALVLALWQLVLGQLETGLVLFRAVFTVATAMLVGLSYTGNSPISNYTLVRQEIARFLPVLVLLYLVALSVYILV